MSCRSAQHSDWRIEYCPWVWSVRKPNTLVAEVFAYVIPRQPKGVVEYKFEINTAKGNLPKLSELDAAFRPAIAAVIENLRQDVQSSMAISEIHDKYNKTVCLPRWNHES